MSGTFLPNWLNLDARHSLADGDQMMQMAAELFPLHRSVTGPGVRATLQSICRRVPIELRSVPSGQVVLDWQVPNEWNIRDAWIREASGKKLIDLGNSTLHLVGYSTGIDQRLTCHQLADKIHTLPEYPEWIPYRTSYYRSDWGFCARHYDWQSMVQQSLDQSLHVRIEAEHQPGRLDYGELMLPGESQQEFLISTHICHPALANDNLSGIVVATQLAKLLAAQPNRPMTFRFLFIPATIGAITWLSLNTSLLQRIQGGLVLSNLGDAGPFNYKRSRLQTAKVDRVAAEVLSRLAPGSQLRDFTPWGYDERQFCSPGFNLPVGRLTRTPEGEYPQYHTSADDLSFISSESLAQSLGMVAHIIAEFTATDTREIVAQTAVVKPFWSPDSEANCCGWEDTHKETNHYTVANVTKRLKRYYLNMRPFGEPKLDRYGLYNGPGQSLEPELGRAILWMLSLSDGRNSLSDIATRSGCDPELLGTATDLLLQCNLLQELP